MRFKTLYALLLVAMLAGCSDKGNDTTDASIIGQWTVVAVELNGESKGVPTGWQFDFRADHTRYERVGEPDAEWEYQGTWSLSDNQLTLTLGESIGTYNLSIENDTMTIAGPQGDDWIEIQLLRAE